MQLLFTLFPFYSHTRELVFDCFQCQDLDFSFYSIIPLFVHIISSHNPKSYAVRCGCARDRGGHVLRQNPEISGIFLLLVSSARVSLSCLIKQGLIPPSVSPIPKVP